MYPSLAERAWTLLLILLLAALCLGLVASRGEGGTYHVSSQGNDTHPGTAAAPWRTITKATQMAQPGDTVQIGPGTYSERLTFARGGTAAAPITYQGTRSGDQWQTVIDGTQPVTATWTAAGSGIYTASLGYDPWVLSAGGRFVWRCGDHAMQSGACQTRLAHSATATCNMSIGSGPCWDGVEALYGVQSGVTRLRFRNGENPSTKSVRAGPKGGTIVVNGQHYLTFKDLKIVGGGERTVDLKGGAQGTVIDGCYIAAPMWRVHLEGNVRDTTITRSTFTMDGIGLVTHTPGDWDASSPARIVNRWLYDTGKFLIGNTQTHDASILLYGATNTTITHNVFKNAGAGITWYSSTSDTEVAHNQIFQHFDNGMYLDSDSSSGTIHHNLIYDNDHGMRWNATHRTMVWDVYANRFWGATAEGKNIYIAGPKSPPSGSNIQFYHNSCAGGGWCLDVGSDGAQVNLSFVHAQNLMHSARGLSSWGGVQWGTMQNVYNDSTTWKGKPLGDFVLPAGHPALDSAPTLTLPGMDAAYYVDGKADHGSIQAGVTDGSGGNGGGPPPPAGDTTPPQVSMTAPTDGAIVSGVVAVTAQASDNIKVVGVQFYANNEPRGSEQCCQSVEHSAVDTTQVPNGIYVLTAEARDAAGNLTMSAPVSVTVYNGPPEPPEPPPGTHPSLSCTGDLLAAGKLSMVCAPFPPP